MKKILNIVIILTISVLYLNAQKTRDVLYLKNGSIINGTLVEIINNQYKIRTSDGSIFMFSSDEVDRFIKEMPSFGGRKVNGPGYAIETGILLGSQKENEIDNSFSFNIIASMTHKTRNILGAGSGVEFIGRTYMPLFLEYKHLMTDKRTAPFLFFRAGNLFHIGKNGTNDHPVVYSWPQPYINSKYRGGPSLTAGTGISWAKDDFESYVSFAYRYASTKEIQIYELLNNVTYKNYYNRFEIKLGFKF